MPQKLEHIPLPLRHHTTDPHHAGVSPEMTVDPEHAHPANTITKPQKTIFQFTSNTLKSKDRKYKQVTIDDLPSEYYSSDEQDSDSESYSN